MKYHIQAIYKIIFKVDYFLLMGFNEQKGEVNHKTLQTGADLGKWHGGGIGCVISGGLRWPKKGVSLENILISQGSLILSKYRADELVSEKLYRLSMLHNLWSRCLHIQIMDFVPSTGHF